MPTESPSSQADDAPLKAWRQGDYALNVGGFLFATPPAGEDAYDSEEQINGIIGLVAISQTCDIVRRKGGRYYVAMCPLIEVEEKDVAAIKKGLRPYLTDVPAAGLTAFADLRRIMSVDKDLVRTWKRYEGFPTEEGQVRFAAALERKFGQFAFPDEFDLAVEPFRKRVWQRHDKNGSPAGKVYRSLEQIRFRADPCWSSENRTISVIAILKPKLSREASQEEIFEELKNTLDKIEWPDGYKWAEPNFVLTAATDLTAADIILSRRGDFDFLCY